MANHCIPTRVLKACNTVPLAKEFAAIRRLPSVVWAVLVCLSDRARPLVAKLDARKIINLFIFACRKFIAWLVLPPAIDPCNTTETAIRHCTLQVKLSLFSKKNVILCMRNVWSGTDRLSSGANCPFHLVDAPPPDRMLQFCNKTGLKVLWSDFHENSSESIANKNNTRFLLRRAAVPFLHLGELPQVHRCCLQWRQPAQEGSISMPPLKRFHLPLSTDFYCLV